MNPTEELVAEMGCLNRRTTLRRLLDAGANINVQDKNGLTVLMWAISRRSLEWCTELLERGANLQLWDHDGFTAWDCLQPYYDNTHYYSLLLQYGADVNQYSPGGWTQLHRACEYNHHSAITLLLTQGADPRLPIMFGHYKGQTAYDFDPWSFWRTPEGIRERLRWDTLSIQEVFIVASELGLVPVPSYLW